MLSHSLASLLVSSAGQVNGRWMQFGISFFLSLDEVIFGSYYREYSVRFEEEALSSSLVSSFYISICSFLSLCLTADRKGALTLAAHSLVKRVCRV